MKKCEHLHRVTKRKITGNNEEKKLQRMIAAISSNKQCSNFYGDAEEANINLRIDGGGTHG